MTRMMCFAMALLTACLPVHKFTMPPTAAPATGSSVIADLANMTPVPVVPSSEAPPIEASGRGWHCFEYRAGDRETGTRCSRTLDDCRLEAAEKARSQGGSTREPIKYDVGFCGAQPQAFCHYLWSSISATGQYYCFGQMEECSHHQDMPWSGVAKQTACEAKD
jgi:hypothetical protein